MPSIELALDHCDRTHGAGAPGKGKFPARPPMLARVMNEDVLQAADHKILVERK